MRKAMFFLSVLALLLWPISEPSHAQQLEPKVYWMMVVEVPLGHLSEYHAFAKEEQNPLMEKHGYKIIATWQTIVGPVEEVIVVAEFASMADYHKARVSLVTSEAWKTAGAKTSELTRSIQTRFLSALPYSSIK